MESHALQDFQSALTCSICMNYFLEPVTIDCGHTLCQPCLYFCWDEAQTPRCCPQCREVAEKTDYRTNTVVKKLVSLARQARPHSDSNSGEQLCRRNGETKGLFCEVDKSLLSAPCSESPEHAVHSYSPVACMAEENREKIVKKMDPLWQKTQEMQDNLNKEIRKSESFVDYVVLRRNMIKVQYQMMHRFLLEEERFQLKTLEREAQEILQQLRDSAIRMAQHREKLKEMYRELTELCHKSDMELLQVTKDLEDIFERIKLLEMQKLQPVNPELSSLHITGILDMLNKFRVHNGLIQGWANRYMSLPDEVRNRIFGGDGATENPQTLESYVIWSVVAFNSGKHYWEVDVGNTSNWIIRVCKDFTSDSFEGKKGFVLFSLKKNNHCILSTNSPSLIHYLQRPTGRVGVFLDYENETMSFYDVCRGSLIYSFFSSSITSPLTPFLVFGSP
ncbi:tripartite motif-containing protein 64-like [Marmota marmota marmota]|uniref:tripartite motif-containing protein 64-like n=1 Tax=Marmota marmota marmota TaxID=9994 RepID=UPI0020937BDB|nr:tripartite motif-containing protein 64-like [Marmota marmota marmota]